MKLTQIKSNGDYRDAGNEIIDIFRDMHVKLDKSMNGSISYNNDIMKNSSVIWRCFHSCFNLLSVHLIKIYE